MKVYMGPYKNWVGPYQIASWLKIFGVSNERCRKIGKYLSETWVMYFCQWIEKKRKRKIKVKIDNYDVWGLYDTLAAIIYPSLVRLQKVKGGAPFADDEDVPPGIGLKKSEAPKVEDWETDDNHFKRWDWILNEMIFSFEQIHKDLYDDMEFKDGKIDYEYRERVQNGFRLFAKYYLCLWD